MIISFLSALTSNHRIIDLELRGHLFQFLHPHFLKGHGLPEVTHTEGAEVAFGPKVKSSDFKFSILSTIPC